MKILILEDNEIHKNRLVKAIGKEHEVVTFASISEAHQHLKITDCLVDLFFVDVELPDGTGIDFAKTLRKSPEYLYTWVVFVTSYSHFLFDAVRKCHCYDYIVKPIEAEHVQDIITKREHYEMTVKKESCPKELLFQSQGIFIKLSPQDILCFEAQKKDCLLYTKSGTYTLKRQSLKKIEAIINGCHEFKKVHRSYIVNENHVSEVVKYLNRWEVRFSDHPLKVPISEKYKINQLVGAGY